MRKTKTTALCVTALLAVLGLCADRQPRQSLAPRSVVLLTEPEAERLRFAKNEPFPMIATRSVSQGPFIEIREPKVQRGPSSPLIQTKTPANLRVLFIPNRAPVDMTSLEVTARKGFFWKTLTPILRPYIRGSTLAVNQVELQGG